MIVVLLLVIGFCLATLATLGFLFSLFEQAYDFTA